MLQTSNTLCQGKAPGRTLRHGWLAGCLLMTACATSPVPVVPEQPLDDGGWNDSAMTDTVTAQPAVTERFVPAEEATTSTPPVIPLLEVQAPPVASAGGGRTHVCQKGDTLMGLSRRYYGSATGWRDILAANRAGIVNPDRILVGQVLIIP